MCFANRFLVAEEEESGLLALRVRSKWSFSSEWRGRAEGPWVAALEVGVTERVRVGSSSVDDSV
jgi:hypothetical protein